jgi:hypothetical protein
MSYASKRLAEIAAEAPHDSHIQVWVDHKRLGNRKAVVKQRAHELRRRRHAKSAGLVTPEVCDCCGLPPKDGKSLALDHCHTTGDLRGWLCHGCNLGIGLLGDTADSVIQAVSYLHRKPLGWALRSTKHSKDGTDCVAVTAMKDQPKAPPSQRVAGMLPWLEWLASGEYAPAMSDLREDEQSGI